MIAPASTGSDRINSRAVINTAHTNNGRCSIESLPLLRAPIIVTMKLIAPRIDLAPAPCNLKIAKSTPIPLWNWALDKGGYTVHPVPTPLSTVVEASSRASAGTSSQKERLFIRGKAISTTPSIMGSSQLPNPPIAIGITMKKIMINA